MPPSRIRDGVSRHPELVASCLSSLPWSGSSFACREPAIALRDSALLLLWLGRMPQLGAAAARRRWPSSLVAETDAPAAGRQGRPSLSLMRPQPGLARLLEESRRCRRRAAGRLAAAGRASTAGPLQYPVPDAADRRRPHELCLRGRLCPAGRPRGARRALAPGATVPVRARLDYLVCTDRDLRARDGRARARARRRRGAGAREPAVRPLPPGAAAAARQRRRGSSGAAAGCGSPSRCRPRSALDDPYFFPLTARRGRPSARRRACRARGDLLIVETAAGGAAGAAPRSKACSRSAPGTGLALAARPGAGAGRAATPVAGRGQAPERRQGLGHPARACAARSLGGLLLNVMPCVFPILSLKALSLARAGRDRGGGAARGARLCAPACPDLPRARRRCCSRCAPAAARSAGRSSSRIRGSSCSCCCWSPRSRSTSPACSSFRRSAGGDGLARSGGAARRLLDRRARRLRRHALHRPVHGRRARRGPGPAGRRRRWRCSPASASASLCPSCCSASSPRCAAACRGPGPWMARFRRILSVPMFLTALGLAWILGRQTGVDGHGARPRRGARCSASACGGPARPARLAGRCARGRARSRRGRCCCRPPRRARRGRAGGPARRRAVQRGAARRSCAPRARPVFVYFTADWCLTCKVNEARRAIGRDGGRRGLRAARGSRSWSATGPAATRRSAASSSATAAPACRSTSIIRRAGEAEILPQILTVGRLTALARRWSARCGGAAEAASAAVRPDLAPAADPGLEHLGLADLGAGRCRAKMSRSMSTKSAYLPALERAEPVLGEAGISGAAGEGGEGLLELISCCAGSQPPGGWPLRILAADRGGEAVERVGALDREIRAEGERHAIVEHAPPGIGAAAAARAPSAPRPSAMSLVWWTGCIEAIVPCAGEARQVGRIDDLGMLDPPAPVALDRCRKAPRSRRAARRWRRRRSRGPRPGSRPSPPGSSDS